MSFNSNNLELISVNTVPGLPQFWGYNSGLDTIAQVSGGDYFKYFAESNATGFYNFKFNIGDQIYCVCSDGNVSLDVTGLVPDVTTTISPAGSAVMQSRTITQNAHGFAVQDILKFAGGIYAKAQANSLSNSQVVGMVAAVNSPNEFVLVYGGYVTGLSGLTANTTFYLSTSSAGALQNSEPATPGQVSRPLLIATSTTTGYFFLGRSNLINPADTDTALSQVVTQNAHGFAVNDVIYLSALNTYAKAQANALGTSQVVGIVSAVADAANFTYVSSGAVSGLSGLTAATAHYLSPSVAGALTTTQPTTTGQFVVPVIDAISTTAGFVNPGQPIAAVAPVTAGGTGVATLTTAYGTLVAGTTPTGTIQTVAPGTSGQVLTSNGVAAVPSYQTLNAGSVTYPPSSASSSSELGGFSFACVPGLFSGTTFTNSQTAAIAIMMNQSIVFIPFFAFKAVTFTQIRFNVETELAGSTVTAGCYASNTTSGLPTGASIATGQVSTATPGSKIISALSIPMTANTLYWFAIQASSDTTLSLTSAPLNINPIFSLSDGPAATYQSRWIIQTNTYSAGTLPTVGTLDGWSGGYVTALPALWLA